MEDRKGFQNAATEAAKQLKEVIHKGEAIRYLSHFDADGISSAGILSLGLQELDAHIHLTIVQNFTPDLLAQIAKEKPAAVVFTDFGSGQIPAIEKHLGAADLFIFDHHPVSETELKKGVHLNPNQFGISGVDCISAAGVTYYVAKELAPNNRTLPCLAIVGAMGDQQDKGPRFSLYGINEEIVQDSVKIGSVEVSEDLRFFGRETRPIHVALQHTTTPYIPGITGDSDGALRFLTQTGIPLREGESWRSMVDLTANEKKLLVTKLVEYILKKNGDVDVLRNIIGTIYTFKNELSGTEMREAREYASLLNACGRTGRPSYGVAIAVGDRGSVYSEVQTALKEYRMQIATALNWLLENKQNTIIEKKIVIGFHSGNIINERIIGTVASIVISSNLLGRDKVIIAMADAEDGSIKASGRTTQELVERGINIGVAFKEALAQVDPDLEAGGHNIAAGARLSKANVKKFLQVVDKIFLKQLGEDA